MIDHTNRNFLHRCPRGHTWDVYGDLSYSNNVGIFSYDTLMSALCHKCFGLNQHTIGMARLRLEIATGDVYAFHLCRDCSLPMYTKMDFCSEAALGLDTLQGYAYWRLPQPFPLYCEDCAKIRGVSYVRTS